MAGRKRAEWVERRADGSVQIRIHAQPGATQAKVGEVDAWRGALTVKVRAKPQDGAANDELLELLAEALGVARAAVELAHGATGRDKAVRVAGMSAEDVRRRLGGNR